MKRKIIIALLFVIIIGVTSGTYAFLSDDNYELTNQNSNNENITINNSQDNSNLISNLNKTTHQLNSNNTNNALLKSSLTKIIENNVFSKSSLVKILADKNDENIYYNYLTGWADHYIQCPQCGGYNPVGPVSNPLPEEALCHNSDNVFGADYKNYAISRDEAYNLWVEYGEPNHIGQTHVDVPSGYISYHNQYGYGNNIIAEANDTTNNDVINDFINENTSNIDIIKANPNPNIENLTYVKNIALDNENSNLDFD